jgi:hypothetical protein
MNEKFDKNKYHWCGVLNEAFIRLTVEKAVWSIQLAFLPG